MPLRVPAGCLGAGEPLGGRKQVRRVAATRLATAGRREKQPGTRESAWPERVRVPSDPVSRLWLPVRDLSFQVQVKSRSEAGGEKVGGFW